MSIPFVKMHALGNDFVVMRGKTAPRFDAAFIRRISNRRTGIGFDQLLWLEPPHSEAHDVFYRIFNADGGEVEQCGNGARCIARLLAGDGPDHQSTFLMEYGHGVVNANITVDGLVSVGMGIPNTEPAALPFVTTQKAAPYQTQAAGQNVEFRVVSMGNPHAVLMVDDIDNANVADLGPALERHECFPNRANIGFMQVLGNSHIKLRVFERGVGETQACGTGACAAAVAGQLAGLLGNKVTVSLPGGDVEVHWSGPDSEVYLTGEAITVFEGQLNDNL
ncbi:MAG: diaminopimelate epimerase [Gammaproteobacteria bacterium]|nr:diaminopimelate epimerase [Gammaproteobacteria bacterium]